MEKLVRDKLAKVIPEAMLSICVPKEKFNYLEDKLKEEIEELQDSNYNDPYEYADVIEVLYAMASFRGISKDNIEAARIQKLEGYGGFETGLIFENP